MVSATSILALPVGGSPQLTCCCGVASSSITLESHSRDSSCMLMREVNASGLHVKTVLRPGTGDVRRSFVPRASSCKRVRIEVSGAPPRGSD